MLCHCKTKLKKIGENLYSCPKCGCEFKICIVRKSQKCAEKERNVEMKSLKEIRKKKRGKKRGRPRKN